MFQGPRLVIYPLAGLHGRLTGFMTVLVPVLLSYGPVLLVYGPVLLSYGPVLLVLGPVLLSFSTSHMPHPSTSLGPRMCLVS